MLRKILIGVFILGLGVTVQAQELNCKVKVVSPSIQRTDKQIFESLQNSVFQFMNNRKWTNKKVKNQERIECNFIIEITEFSGVDKFKATVQIQSTRPVYGSTYNSILFNYKDISWSFKYQEFQPLEFNQNATNEQLPSLLAYYANIVLGLDFDSYSKKGGTKYFDQAQAIVNNNQGKLGWNRTDGKGSRNKYYLIQNILNDRFKTLRTLYFTYHRKGMDKMYKDQVKARKKITESIETLQELARSRPNSSFLKMFFTSKADELVQIYKGSTAAEKNKMVTLLSKLDPANAAKYAKIKEK
jgi:hypothetical protein